MFYAPLRILFKQKNSESYYRYIHLDFNFHPYEIFINGLRKKALLFKNKKIHFCEYWGSFFFILVVSRY